VGYSKQAGVSDHEGVEVDEHEDDVEDYDAIIIQMCLKMMKFKGKRRSIRDTSLSSMKM